MIPKHIVKGAKILVEVDHEGWVAARVFAFNEDTGAVEAHDGEDTIDVHWGDTKPLFPGDSRWRLLALENPADTVDWRRIVLLEQLDTTEPVLPHVCESIVEGETWTPATVVPDGERLQMDFPSTDFQGMPVRMFLECSKQRVLGSRWRLLDVNGTDVTAELILRRSELITGADVLQIENFYRTGRRRRPPDCPAMPKTRRSESPGTSAPAEPTAPSRGSSRTKPKPAAGKRGKTLSKS